MEIDMRYNRVYKGLIELVDIFPKDLLEEILGILNFDSNDWRDNEVGPRSRLEIDIYDLPVKEKIEIFLKQCDLIESEEFVSSIMIWEDKKLVDKKPFLIPLHIDPYKLIYKTIQIYLNDNNCPGSVWFNTDVYHELSSKLAPTAPGDRDAVVYETDVQDSYVISDHKRDHILFDQKDGKEIKYGKNRGYMLKNSLINPLPHAVPHSSKVESRASLYIIIQSPEYINWLVQNEDALIGGFRVDEDVPLQNKRKK